MLLRFLITILSSWVINPLGVLLVNLFGYGGDKFLTSIIILTGTCLPFQLLINECIAAKSEKYKAAAPSKEIAIVILFQFMACVTPNIIFNADAHSTIEILLISFLLCINTVNSYMISRIYYRLVLNFALNRWSAAVVGFLPGAVNLILYSSYCVSRKFFQADGRFIILLTVIIPGLVQYAYLIRKRNFFQGGMEIPAGKAEVTGGGYKSLIFITLKIYVISAISIHLRGKIAEFYSVHGALILVFINSASSVLNAATRSSYLSGNFINTSRTLGIVTIFFIFCAIAVSFFNGYSAYFIEIITVQIAVAWLISNSRSSSVMRMHLEER